MSLAPSRTPPASPAPGADPATTRPLVVFDLDGTLVDSAPDLANGLNHCLALAGHAAVPLDIVRPHAGRGVRPMLEFAYAQMGLALSRDEMEEQAACFLAHYEAHIADLTRPFPGAVAAMDRLSRAGHALAVCTNKTERLSRLLLTELGLLDRFAAVCGADTFARRKPDPVHLLGTIEKAGGRPAAAVMVGDTSADIDAAFACGVPSILVDFGYGADDATRARATRIVTAYDTIDAASIETLIGGRAQGG